MRPKSVSMGWLTALRSSEHGEFYALNVEKIVQKVKRNI
jgi:hypothetical protein